FAGSGMGVRFSVMFPMPSENPFNPLTPIWYCVPATASNTRVAGLSTLAPRAKVVRAAGLEPVNTSSTGKKSLLTVRLIDSVSGLSHDHQTECPKIEKDIGSPGSLVAPKL